MPIPVTILNGFLGAGKTTLLQNFLMQAARLKDVHLGVIVNEMSTLDVDGTILDTTEVISRKSPHFATLPSGSIAAKGGQARLREAVEKVLADGEVTHLIVETSGSTHPWPLLTALRDMKEVALHGFLSVADSRALWQDFDSGKSIHAGASSNLAAGKRGLENLLAEQIMFANRILLSKTDKVPADVLQAVAQAIHPLNPYADIIGMQWGNLKLEQVLAMPPYDYARVETLGRELTDWDKTHGGEMAEPESYRIDSRVIDDPRPFHPQRLWDVYNTFLGVGIYRSKGFFWLPTRDELVLLWNQSAGSVGLEIINYWKIRTLEDERLNLSPEERAGMEAKLMGRHPLFGDRHCRLTVIGDEDGLDAFVAALQDCFCTEAEIAAWLDGQPFDDPWPATVARLKAT
jgi:G3E family GTPase